MINVKEAKAIKKEIKDAFKRYDEVEDEALFQRTIAATNLDIILAIKEGERSVKCTRSFSIKNPNYKPYEKYYKDLGYTTELEKGFSAYELIISGF